MHGVVHSQFKNFVEKNYGPSAWQNTLVSAGFTNKIFVVTSSYPDEQIMAIVRAASQETGVSASALLEAFGEYLFPILAKMYENLINPEWKTMEFLLKVEDTIHAVVRRQTPDAHPPRLHFQKIGPNQLRLRYNSPRRLQSLAKGMLKAVAKRYGETIAFDATKTQDGFDVVLTIT